MANYYLDDKGNPIVPKYRGYVAEDNSEKYSKDYFDKEATPLHQQNNKTKRIRPKNSNQPLRRVIYPQKKSNRYNTRSNRNVVQRVQPSRNRILNNKSNLTAGLTIEKGKKQLIVITIVLFLLSVLCAWQLSPFNLVNRIKVRDNYFVSESEFKAIAQIYPWDKREKIKEQEKEIEEKIIKELPIIDSIKFKTEDWKEFNIFVKEHRLIGRVVIDNEETPIFDNGDLLGIPIEQTPYPLEKVNQLPILINFNQKGKVHELASMLENTDPKIINQMEKIYLLQDSSKKNAVEIKMVDGNIVKGIMDTLPSKLSKYDSMIRQLGNKKGVINLEVGAYFSPDVSNVEMIKLNIN